MSNTLRLTPVKLRGVSDKAGEIWIPEDERPKRNGQNSVVVKIDTKHTGESRYKIRGTKIPRVILGGAGNDRQARKSAARQIEQLFEDRVQNPNVVFDLVKSNR